MGAQMEIVKDLEGNNHLIFDESSIYDDSQMGDSFSDFEILQILSNDNSSLVSKVRSLNNHKIYAMKIIKLNQVSRQYFINKINNEFNKYKNLNNPHILKYYKVLYDDSANPDNIYLIMEFMNNSDIEGYIRAHQILEKNIKEEEIWNILLQCLSALDYLYEKNLRFHKILMNNEQNVKIGAFINFSLDNQNNCWRNDLEELGRYFYIMCFSQDSRVKNANSFSEVYLSKDSNSNYSSELMNIIYSMISKENHDSVQDLYKTVKNKYEKKYAKNTSIKAVLRCLYAYPKFNKKMKLLNSNNQNKYYINYYLNVIKALSGYEEDDLKKCIIEFRRAIASENSKLDGNREIDPLYLLAFLLEKMHKETNKKEGNTMEPENVNKKYVISSEFNGEEEDKTNKDHMIQKFREYFNANFNSPISDLFFGFVKTKRNCQTCRTGNYTFSNFCFVVFDLSNNKNKEFDLIEDGFKTKHYEHKIIEPDQPNRVYCERCLSFQKHYEFNRYYLMNKQLIISFIRGNNYKNCTSINFEEKLNLEPYLDIKGGNAPTCFYLVGSIIRVVNQQEEKFEYYAKDPDNNNTWYTSEQKLNLNSAPINYIKNQGQIIMLFYNAINNNYNQ